MTVTTLVKVSVFTAALGFACLLPGTVRAQADVSPDFFELSNTAPPEGRPTQMTTTADFDGTFSLPYDVKCSGQNLKSGQYTLSVKSDGANRMVSIRRAGAEQMNIRVRRTLGNSPSSRSAVLVWKSGESRLMQAVYVQKLNALLYLDDIAEGSLVRMERLPIR